MLISSPDAMTQFGKKITTDGHRHILLYGGLGAGKTHCVIGFVDGRGGKKNAVTSPTYAYYNLYPTPNGEICHIDMYRISDPQTLLHKGILDAIDHAAMVIIERPKREYLYADAEWKTVNISICGVEEREIKEGWYKI